MNPAEMGEWLELGQSVLIGLIFAFLVAKLISTVISFRGENLRVVHERNLPEESEEPESEFLNAENRRDTEHIPADAGAQTSDGKGHSLDDIDDDWEGVESTELDEMFSAASTFVAASASDRLSQKLSSDVQLQLYGLYKIATEGPCSVPQPSSLKVSARAKWNAWQRLGSMPPEEAMEKYIDIVNKLYPSWTSGSTINKDGDGSEHTSAAKGLAGPVFSTFVYEEGSDDELKLDAIHAAAREGEIQNLTKYIENGVPVNLPVSDVCLGKQSSFDSEGRTPLHWAVDRGHISAVELLISRDADVNVQDNDGQTPLHYAVVCEREAIAEFLLKQNADPDIKDNDGDTPRNLCKSEAWKCLQPVN